MWCNLSELKIKEMLRAIGKTTPLLMESILKKTLSLSACSPKSFVIKDHFDFDKKVNLSLKFYNCEMNNPSIEIIFYVGDQL